MERSFLEGRTEFFRQGFRWWLDARESIDNAIINMHGGEGWEPDSLRAIRRIVQPGMVVCDVGANIGWFTVLMAGMVGPAGKVYAFEPMAEPRSLVERHVAMNALTNVEISDIALSDTALARRVRCFKYSWPWPGDDVAQPENEIRFGRLDVVAAEWPRLDFMKIDVDGYERRIIRGAGAALRRLRPIIEIEVCDYTLVRTEARLANIGADAYEASLGYVRGSYACALLMEVAALGYTFVGEDFSPTTIEAVLASRNLSEGSVNVIALPLPAQP